MTVSVEKIPELIRTELATLWAAHYAAGLKGYMCLYSLPGQTPMRSKEPGIVFWFGVDDIDAAANEVMRHYNQGQLPNTPLLLNPIVHKKNKDGTYTPLGSGVIWCTSLCLGVDTLKDESCERIWELGVQASPFHRGDNQRAGLKIVGFCDEAQPVGKDGKTVMGCKELYELADIKSEAYAPLYLLSGIAYLTNHGMFDHPGMATLFPSHAPLDAKTCAKLVKDSSIRAQKILDAAHCWNAYERHHSLYQKFGTDPADISTNMEFFNLVARDVDLFDATGPMRQDADDIFEFIVPGLIPRGSVALLAAAGSVGKSTLAHHLCVLAATDYEMGEEAPRWLGQRVSIEKCKGVSIYFSGEDGPAIINARASIFDPRGRARRLMFQRADFGEDITFAQHLKRLYKVPDVPIMVIDPARKFLSGDEEDSSVVSEFFDAIEEFAIKKRTAVLVVQHLQKGAYPRSAVEVLDNIRGSQVFIDRARVIIGLFRDGPYTIAGLAKNNIPPNLGMVMEERVFARDAKRLQLVWVPGQEGVRRADLTPQEIEKLLQDARKEGR